jgi:hypothetical protein
VIFRQRRKNREKGQVSCLLRLCWHTDASCVAWLPQERSLSLKPTRCLGKCAAAASANERLPGLRRTTTVAWLPLPTLSAWHLVSCLMLGYVWDSDDSSPPCHKLITVAPVDMLSQHPSQVRTICSYSPWLPESRSTCMFSSL